MFMITDHLPANDLNSYRPNFDLSFISKILEKAVSCCFNVQLNHNHLSNVFHSVYKQIHSVETVLLKVQGHRKLM